MFRDPFSLRQGEGRLCERGIDIGHETVRDWWNRFGPVLAAEIRKRRVHHRFYSLWRGPLDAGVCPDQRDDPLAMARCGSRRRRGRGCCHEPAGSQGWRVSVLTRAMTRDGRPASIVTDGLPSSRAAMKVIGNEGGQETRRWRNNRAEHSQQPLRTAGRGHGSGQSHQDPCSNAPPSRPRSTTMSTTHASSLAATCSNTAAPPPWPSGVNVQSESP